MKSIKFGKGLLYDWKLHFDYLRNNWTWFCCISDCISSSLLFSVGIRFSSKLTSCYVFQFINGKKCFFYSYWNSITLHQKINSVMFSLISRNCWSRQAFWNNMLNQKTKVERIDYVLHIKDILMQMWKSANIFVIIWK